MHVFFEIHRDLLRQGPGSNMATRKALAMMDGLPEAPTLLDVGCGPGMQTLELARRTGGKIIAVDNHRPFLDEVAAHARAAGLAGHVQPHCVSMLDMDFPEASFDAIWSEGAIYNMGFEAGLRAWRRWLKPQGYIAVTEACWLRPDPPGEVKAFWDNEYPAMESIEANRAIVRAAGYQEIGHFILPPEDWWTHYYTPLEARLPVFREKYRNDPDALSVINAEQAEIELFRKYADCYGYVFFVMRRPGAQNTASEGNLAAGV